MNIMRRRVLSLAALIISAGSIFAQGEMDAYKLSQTDLTGTARAVSMGGAFGALGGDISGIAINPAGIGVYRSSEIVTTMNFQNAKTTIESNLEKRDDSKFKFTFDNLAFVAAFPTSDDVVPFINFGFSYNRVKNFDRKYSMGVTNPDNHTMADYMADRANAVNFGGKDPASELSKMSGNYYTALDNYDWMAVFGYNSGLIGLNGGRFNVLDQLYPNSDNYLAVREKGSVDTYDFNVGTTFSDIVSVGLTVSVTDLKYRMYSQFDELYTNDSYAYLDNDIRTDGTGYQVSAGIIVKPVNELRIGLAYHSPTWYNMTDSYAADFEYNLQEYGLKEGWISTDFYHYDYKLRTPDRWTASLAGVIGNTAIISADYEYTNYGSNMKLYDDHGDPLNYDANVDIKNHFKGSSTLRVGAEIRITPQFSGRIGYQWKQSPLKKDFKDGNQEVMTAGTTNHYTLDGDTNYITYGLGYRFSKNFYTDIAFVMRTQKSDIYTFYGSEKSEWKDNTFQGLMTLGYRF